MAKALAGGDSQSARDFITAEDLGTAMTALRGEATQKSCARRAGLDRPTWNQYEKGNLFPKPDNIERIAQGLGVGVVDLAEAVVQAWSKRVGRDPFVERPEPEVYEFSASGQMTITPAGRPKDF